MLKPTNSVGQGAYCFSSYKDDPELDSKLFEIPGEEIVFQEFVEYTKIYRVIVIGGKALEKAVFVDQANENRWKVSVCLNPEMTLEENPEVELLLYAENIAKVFEGEIAFVDVYKTKDAYVLSEINTACNLTLHEKMSGYNISADIAKYLLSKI
jgi:glutathione synthase/RimK-type ligase-like ATP-grasp enzyme